MTLVDTATWVDFLHDRDTPATGMLDRLLSRERIILGDLVWYELLRGFRRDSDFELAHSLLEPLERRQLVTPEVSRAAVGHFRLLRNQFQTAPDTVSMMVASYCLEYDVPLLFSKPVFHVIAGHLGLQDRMRSGASSETPWT